MFKVVPEVPEPLLIFLNSCFFILFWWNVYYSVWSKLMIWVLVSFLSLLVPCIFCFILLWVVYNSSFILWLSSINTVSILITSVLNSASDRLAISLHRLVLFFSGAFICSFIWSNFYFVLVHLFCHKGWSLRYSPGPGNWGSRVVALYLGEGSKREQWCLFSFLPAFSHFLCYPQANWALLVLIPRWVGLCTF